MSIVPSEIRWNKSQVVSDGGSNGGRISAVVSPNAVKNNDFPDVTLSERTTGIRRYRKLFVKIANDADLVLQNCRAFMQLNTPGDDAVTFFPGTQRDVQSSLLGTERLYGAGRLNAQANAGALTFQVITEGAALNYLRTGDLIRITDKTTLADAGAEEFHVASNVSYAGDIATVTIPTPGLANSFAAGVSGVSSVYVAGDVKTVISAPAKTSAAGTVDFGAHPILGDNIGTTEQDWTLTFTSPTAFNIVGDTVGNVGAGNVSSNTAPANPLESSKPYFTIQSAAFGGTFAPGDTITFTTSPAALPLWHRQDVPAGAAALSGNRVITGVDGESA